MKVEAFSTTLSTSFRRRHGSTTTAAAQKKSGGAGVGFGAAPSRPETYTPDTSKETSDLMNFLCQQGAKGIGRELGTEIGFRRSGSGMRGLYATRNFKEGDILCQIPSDCALALSDPALGGDDVPTLAHCGQNFLRLYVHHAQNSVVWEPYLNCLPTPLAERPEFSPTPDYFTPEEISALEFPLAVQQVQERQADIAKLAANDGVDEFELQFATWIVSSRSISLQISTPDEGPLPDAEKEEDDDNDASKKAVMIAAPKKSIRILVPYLDMVNHLSDAPNVESHIIDPEKDNAWFALKAIRPIKAGAEITRSYGAAHSSVELLLDYGFVSLRPNKVDAFMLQNRRSNPNIFDSPHQWSTTLQQDEALLAASGGKDLSDNMKTVLQFRMKLKESYADNNDSQKPATSPPSS